MKVQQLNPDAKKIQLPNRKAKNTRTKPLSLKDKNPNSNLKIQKLKPKAENSTIQPQSLKYNNVTTKVKV